MDSVIVHYQEVALKGRNRPWFINRLVENLRAATADLDVIRVRAMMGRIEIALGPTADWPAVRARVGRIFGIANFARSRASGRSVDEITAAILRHIEESGAGTDANADAGGGRSFRVRATRADKAYELTSPELEREVGGRLKAATGWRVDLARPDVDIRIEVLPDLVFHTLRKEPGPGGLPTGTSAPVLCLLSGGIDSPVAAYRLMKRGCRVHFVHFHAYPLLSHASLEKAREIVELLTRHQMQSRLYEVRFGDLQQQVVLAVPPRLRVVVYRRLMLRIAARLAAAARVKALVTGESVGQVASQTIENLAVIGAAVPLPVLRPLVGSDKEEITREARRLGTYPISIIPDQDCCTLFTPRRPATKASREEVDAAERRLPVERMIDAAAAAAARRDLVFPPAPAAPAAAASPPAAAPAATPQG